MFHGLRSYLRPNKKLSVFLVTGLNILGPEGTHILFSGKKYNSNIILCILKGILELILKQKFC